MQHEHAGHVVLESARDCCYGGWREDVGCESHGGRLRGRGRDERRDLFWRPQHLQLSEDASARRGTPDGGGGVEEAHTGLRSGELDALPFEWRLLRCATHLREQQQQ